MKLIPSVLLNVATVVVALVVYEGLRGESEPSLPDGGRVDAADIDPRLAALGPTPQPTLRAGGQSPLVLQRLEHIDARLAALEGVVLAAPSGGPGNAPTPVISLPGPDAEPTAEAIAAFRRLRDAVQREDWRGHELQRVDKLLAKHDISLTKEQRERVFAVHIAFGERRDTIWDELKTRISTEGARADWKSVYLEANAQIERELGERLRGVLPTADAEAVARALTLPMK